MRKWAERDTKEGGEERVSRYLILRVAYRRGYVRSELRSSSAPLILLLPLPTSRSVAPATPRRLQRSRAACWVGGRKEMLIEDWCRHGDGCRGRRAERRSRGVGTGGGGGRGVAARF